MGCLCYHVYRNEKRTTRYTYSAARLSIMVFKQLCWFVIAFYITWVPYIALQVCATQSAYCLSVQIISTLKLLGYTCFCLNQYMLSSGKGYVNYGLILSAATLVPLQGVWNNFIYIRTRYLNNVGFYVGSTVRRVSSFFRRSSNPKSTEQSALETMQQCAAHEELEVGQVDENSSINVLNEDNKATTSNEEGIDCLTCTKSPEDYLGPKSCVGGGSIKRFSDQCGNDTSVPEDSTNGNGKFKQEDACSPDGNENIDVGTVNETALGKREH